jgi:hypothetical protein
MIDDFVERISVSVIRHRPACRTAADYASLIRPTATTLITGKI